MQREMSGEEEAQAEGSVTHVVVMAARGGHTERVGAAVDRALGKAARKGVVGGAVSLVTSAALANLEEDGMRPHREGVRRCEKL